MAQASRVQETTHFRIHYYPGSFAEQNMAFLGSRLERAYVAIDALVGTGLEDGIDVFLSELVVHYQGYRLGAGGYALPSRGQIHDTYRPDSPGETLERSLVTIFLTRITGEDDPAPFLIDGLLSNVMQRLGSDLTDEEVTFKLAEAKAQGQLPAISALRSGPTPGTREIYFASAASFVGFILHSRGSGGLKDLSVWFDAESQGQAAAPLAKAERDWRKTIKLSAAGGVLHFVKLSAIYLRQYKLKVVEIVLYIVLGVAFTIVMQLVPGWLVDVLHGQPVRIVNHSITSPWPLIIGLASAFVVVSIMSRRQAYLMAFVSASILREMRLRAFTVIQHLHLGYFQTTTTGDIISRMASDMSMVQSALTGPLTQTLQGALTILLAFIVAFHTNWQITLATITFMPLFFVSSHFLGPRAARQSKELQRQLALATSTLQENLGAQQVVKAFSLQTHLIQRFTNDLNAVFRSTLRLTFLTGLYGWIIGATSTAINLFILAVGAWMVLHGQMTAGTLIQFLGLMNQIIGPVRNFAGMVQGLQQASGAMERVDELLNSQSAIGNSPDAVELQPLTEAITFENVTFGYPDAEPTVRNLNLDFRAGTSVALVGRSGSGKSTALNLVMRFYDPSDGRIRVDGVDIRTATLESLRRQTGVVFQDNVLFNTTVRENIRLGDLTASDSDIVLAAQMAEIHDFIMSMPDEYETVVGERGARLSGGQRQRVAIARAILRDPSILLLDEATSALDPVTEAAINDTLQRIGQGRTTITVTHRLSSIKGADHIYVLDQGIVVEHGTHDALLRQRGYYARLWDEQGGGVAGIRQPPPGIDLTFLRRVSMFSHLESELLLFVAGRLSHERIPAGEVIVSHGDVADKMYIIQSGQVEVLDSDPATGNRPLALLHEGDHFGEIALLHDTPRTATVRSFLPVDLYSLSRNDFNDVLVSVPSLKEALESTIADRSSAAAVRGADTMLLPRGSLGST